MNKLELLSQKFSRLEYLYEQLHYLNNLDCGFFNEKAFNIAIKKVENEIFKTLEAKENE